ncbi:hypothetical protein SLNWT_3055 [Streptomyces albus]|uniref:Uncharacterized protein n=1 Tax=Streptomyces albus (strain ATCC 21838 / DSM 41398 / FERM P-419 / JCM 4703 / NBRC 107858) TaxID=1081613 RepID=A0A0B5EXR1_STRA4|nr:hypothetical protein SLNWT_3055 [Streptomyces albus]AOU77740.1 hypothetical protein SLNHY_3049 [Streptomyces albus]AYN33500.1 hypothetical protein DUI70_3000 [Streptomyces albus]
MYGRTAARGAGDLYDLLVELPVELLVELLVGLLVGLLLGRLPGLPVRVLALGLTVALPLTLPLHVRLSFELLRLRLGNLLLGPAEGALRRVLRRERKQRHKEQGELRDPLPQRVRGGGPATPADEGEYGQLVEVALGAEDDQRCTCPSWLSPGRGIALRPRYRTPARPTERRCQCRLIR